MTPARKRLFKTGIILGLAALLGLAGLEVVLPWFSSTRGFRQRLENGLTSVAGRQVSIRDGMRLHLFPRPGLLVRGVEVDNAPGFTEAPMMRCGTLDINFELVPLFFGKVVLTRLAVEDFLLVLEERLEDDWESANWLGLFPDDGEGGEHLDGYALVLASPSVDVGNASVVYRELARNRTMALVDGSFSMEPSREGLTRLSCSLADDTLSPTAVSLHLTGHTSGDTENDNLLLQNGALRLEHPLPGQPGEALVLESGLEMDLDAGRANLTGLEGRGPALRLNGDIRGLDLYWNPHLAGKARLHSADIGAALEALGLPVPSMAVNRTAEASLTLEGSAGLDGIELDGFHATLGSSDLSGRIAARDFPRARWEVHTHSTFIDFGGLLPPPQAVVEAAREQGGLNMVVDDDDEELSFILEVDEDWIEAFRGLDLVLNCTADAFLAGEVQGENLDISASLENGVLAAQSLGADFARGGFTADARGNVTDDSLALDMGVNVRGMPRGREGGNETFVRILSHRFHLSGDKEGFGGSLRVGEFNPRDLCWTLGVDLPSFLKPGTLDRALLDMRFSGGDGIFRLEVDRLEVDRARMRAGLTADAEAHPPLAFTLDLESLDLDRYLPETQAKAGSGLAALENLRGIRPPIPKEFAVSLDLSAKRISASGLRIERIRAQGLAAPGRLSLQSLSGKILGGTVTAEATVSGNRGELSAWARISGRDLDGAEAAALAGVGSVLKGGLMGDVHVEGSGRDLLDLALASRIRTALSLKGRAKTKGGGLLMRDPALGLDVHPRTTRTRDREGRGTGLEFPARVTLQAAGFSVEGVGFEDLEGSLEGAVHLGRDLAVERIVSASGRSDFRLAAAAPKSGREEVSFLAHVDAHPLEVELKDIRARLLGLDVAGHLKMHEEKGGRKLAGRLETDAVRLEPFLHRLGAKVDRSAVLPDKAKASVDFAATDERLSLDNLRLVLDKARIRGKADLLFGPDPALSFDLTARGLDLDGYRFPRGRDDAPFSMADLPRQKVKGRLMVEDFRYHALDLKTAEFQVRREPWIASLRLVEGQAAGGLASGGVQARERGADTLMQADIHWKDFQAGELLAALAGEEYLQGGSWLDLSMTARGGDAREWASTLAGHGSLRVEDGRIRAGGDEHPFRQAKVTFDAARGVVSSRDLKVESRVFTLTGESVVDLPNRRLDCNFTAEAGLVTVPITISGPLDDPAVRVDQAAALRDAVSQVVSLPFKPLIFLKDLLF